jgi:uncharacterized protein (UPF0276 family)
MAHDRFGIGWRAELAAGILSKLHRIDIVEVIADDYFDVPGKQVRALQTLSAQVPVSLHAVGLGMASTIAVDRKRLDSRSEHLAFVRAGGIELGHLAAPPRNANSVEGTLRNLEAAKRATGSVPVMENVATMLDPPGCTMSEQEWLNRVMQQSGCELLLDLHNVHTNATNFGFDSHQFIKALPLERIRTIHIAGGRKVGRRILDDHLHDVPDPVYVLLREVARLTVQPLTVILERDGSYPPVDELLAQLEMARTALAEGRKQRAA